VVAEDRAYKHSHVVAVRAASPSCHEHEQDTNMGSIKKFTKSQWIKKEDVLAMTPAQRRTRIERIDEEQVGDDMRYVAYLDGIPKGWPLNATALQELQDMTGSGDTDDFAGTAIELYVDPSVTFQGKRVGGIKLRAVPDPIDLANVGF
jgi:hypothetical protein